MSKRKPATCSAVAASSFAFASARRARTKPHVAATIPTTRAKTTSDAAVTPTRWRRTNFEIRYRVLGGLALTGS
jgi:hypothetical protein